MTLYKIMLACLLLATGIASTETAAAQPVPYDAATQTVFNRPVMAGGSLDQQFAIHLEAIRLIQAVPTGETIRIAMFSQSNTNISDALLAAKQRGVNIEYVASSQFPDATFNVALRNGLGTDTTQKSYHTMCQDSCLLSGADSGVHHVKLMTISAVTGTDGNLRRYITFITSQNFTNGGTNGWNDAQIIVGDKALYGASSNYIRATRLDKTRYDYPTARSGTTAIFFYPRTDSAYDPALSAMKNVTCRYGSGQKSTTKIRVMMSIWTANRPAMAQKLVARQAQGCDVRVIVTSTSTSRDILKPLLAGKVPVYDAYRDFDGDGLSDIYMHSKTIVVQGMISGREQHRVDTGSANLSYGAVRKNTEAMLKTTDKFRTDRYLQQFDQVLPYTVQLTSVPDWAAASPLKVAPQDRLSFSPDELDTAADILSNEPELGIIMQQP